ncbi:uncharacterized protein [Solanum lycopersicum]|uniref:SHSP domain-containing protein n=1 Tax=Solanum lycopersicum TaxID=4081 RepID=A0A3Q7G6C9_SOLLC|nr:uncharacterized protein LOC101244182 [Solanum lycopersicum]
MEMEMGLKLTRVANESSSTEFQFAKDRAGPLFQSTETDTMFILTVHLKGYIQENIKVDINEEGTIIAIRGEKSVQETVMVGWKLIKKDVEVRKFSKAFKIPDGVILDEIKARFDDEISILTIKMPKKVKGILGIEFVEVKEHEELPIVANKISKKVTFKEDMDKPKAEENQGKPREVVQKHVVKDEMMPNEDSKHVVKDEIMPNEDSKHVVKDEMMSNEDSKHVIKDETMPNVDSNIQNNDTIDETREARGDFVGHDKPESSNSRDEHKDDQASVTSRKREDDNVPKKSSKICVPIVAGSALILSLFVFVIHLIRTKNQSVKRKG